MVKKIMTGKPDYTHRKVENKKDIIDSDKKNDELAQKLLAKPETMDVLKKMNIKFFELVRAKAIINILEKDNLPLSKEHINAIQQNNKLDLEVNALLCAIIGEKNESTQPLESGNVDEAGYFGMNPQAIRNVIFKNGNLRERIYILYRDGYSGFSDKIFSFPDLIDKMNSVLEINQVDCKINKAIIKEICEEGQTHTPYTRGIYSRFVRDEKLRVLRDEKEKEHLQSQLNPKVNDDNRRITPLSEREKIAKTGESPVTPMYGQKANKIDPYVSGSTLYKSSGANHPFLEMNKEIGESFWSGASGITDTILTLAMCLGCDEADLMALRDAATVSMIEDKSHSPHEVYFSSKSFNLPYEPGELNSRVENEQQQGSEITPAKNKKT